MPRMRLYRYRRKPRQRVDLTISENSGIPALIVQPTSRLMNNNRTILARATNRGSFGAVGAFHGIAIRRFAAGFDGHDCGGHESYLAPHLTRVKRRQRGGS
jgi:hypothetical protein